MPLTLESSSTSANVESKPRSVLEGLPVEILSEIFMSSLNPSLPLTSRTLLNLLSTTRNQHQLGHNMLASPSSEVHSDLLRRRFLTFELYHTLTWGMDKDCDDDTFRTHRCQYKRNWNGNIVTDSDLLECAAHFSHPIGTLPPQRLFHNLLERPPQPPKLKKIMFLRRLCYASVDFSSVVDERSYLNWSARDGLLECMDNRNADGTEFFIEYQLDYQGPFSRAEPAFLSHEADYMDCDNVDITYYIIKNLVKRQASPWQRPENFLDWVQERKKRDQKAREEWQILRQSVKSRKEKGEEGETGVDQGEEEEDEVAFAIANRLWVGCWLEFFPEHRFTYARFVKKFYRRRLHVDDFFES